MISLTDLLFQICFRMMLLATIVHEYGHLLALRLMGYRGAIYSNALNMTTALDFSLMTLSQQRVFFLAGGMFQAVVFLIMCIFDKDEEDRLVNKMVAIQGFIYALFEGFTYRMWWQIGGLIGLLASMVFMILVLQAKSNVTQ